jgi:outer membrane protein assembly factor BamB
VSPHTRRQFLIAAGATGLGTLAGCVGGPNRPLPDPPTGDWRQHAHDARNTGAAAASVPPRANPAWDEGEAHTAAPLVADGTVYSVAEEATALDARSGELQWDVDLPGGARHAPALSGDRLFVATDEQLVALEREGGGEVWRRPLRRGAQGAVTATEEPPLVVVPVAGTGPVAVDPATGDRLWQDAIRGPRAVAVAAGTVYAVGYRSDGDTGLLRALDAADGVRRWERELDHPDTAPVVADDGLLVTDGGTLAVHDPAEGARRRDLGPFGDRIDVLPAVAGGTAFVAGGLGGLAAVALADGTVRWRRGTSVAADTGVAVGRDAVVAPVTDKPGVAAFDRADGATRWEHRIEGFDAAASAPAALADDAVFYTSNESIGVVALGDLPPVDGG